MTSKIVAVQDVVLLLLTSFGYSEKEIFRIHLALEEALVNAHKHGNHMNPKKLVAIIWEITEEHFQITIRDEGDGFNPADVPDPTTEVSLQNLEPGGRGLLLMRNTMDSVTFNAKGNEVTMRKTRRIPACCP